jgi:hypothetical protein
MDTESAGALAMMDEMNGSALAEVEPFGWKIGLKAGGQKYIQEQERQKQLR